MQISWARVLPVIVSICIIIVVAILRNQSRFLAAILATMPTNIPLALWVISTGDNFSQTEFVPLMQNLVIGLIPTLFFMVILYFAARAGWQLVPMLIVGYLGWALVLGIGYLLGLFRV
jgi:hypothetical protein